MCYRTSKAQNQARGRVLNTGILLLGAPPFLILAGFVAYVFKRDKPNPDDEQGVLLVRAVAAPQSATSVAEAG